MGLCVCKHTPFQEPVYIINNKKYNVNSELKYKNIKDNNFGSCPVYKEYIVINDDLKETNTLDRSNRYSIKSVYF
ncbi:hypothetical protein EPTV-WA-022 [Eptesipox virus]|uniref:Uncharacterized protein n=1 Tax=Eptesipox virus TaxID=1329402 RepID=A0A220T684_9POXV|nr:hypothetical protein CG743_gp022 [Eptesipox virus]ASK51223.1 hypothetical protein EPTV-WA-022 [Eptesipox virus]WAH70981.1 hypothetical protein CG743_gp022 [Eptesipox virus]